MKKKIVQFVFACLMMQAVFSGSTFGVTTVHITQAMHTFPNGYCPVPSVQNFACSGNATGYLSTDTITVHIYFGDGNDTIIKSPFWYANYFSVYAPHTYYS